ncbi:MAG TPA: tyrosine-type recombinase/integrase [Candidatus Babeliales bacterium]|nr:tyrosine-type recombinase/integrase [Candidatus Babeliales bacterium]
MDELAAVKGLTVQSSSASKSDSSPVAQEVTSQIIHHDNIYIQAATSDNTRRAYRQDIRHFIVWGGKLPTTPDVIVKYLHEHATTLNVRTLARRLIALKNWHVLQGFSDPTNHPLIKKTLTGIKHIHGKPKEKAPALSIEALTHMVNYLKSQDTLVAWRDNALLQVGFFGAFRRSELVNIKWEHVTFMPEGMEIIIPRSKTDQGGEGQVCAIPYGDDSLCPVTALKIWGEKADIQSGFIFRAIDRHDNISASPLSMQSVSLIIKSIAEACHLMNAQQFSSHSLRRGFATTASRKGAPFTSIMRHGRWQHEGTVLGYIEEGQRFLENAAKIILTKE